MSESEVTPESGRDRSVEDAWAAAAAKARLAAASRREQETDEALEPIRSSPSSEPNSPDIEDVQQWEPSSDAMMDQMASKLKECFQCDMRAFVGTVRFEQEQQRLAVAEMQETVNRHGVLLSELSVMKAELFSVFAVVAEVKVLLGQEQESSLAIRMREAVLGLVHSELETFERQHADELTCALAEAERNSVAVANVEKAVLEMRTEIREVLDKNATEISSLRRDISAALSHSREAVELAESVQRLLHDFDERQRTVYSLELKKLSADVGLRFKWAEDNQSKILNVQEELLEMLMEPRTCVDSLRGAAKDQRLSSADFAKPPELSHRPSLLEEGRHERKNTYESRELPPDEPPPDDPDLDDEPYTVSRADVQELLARGELHL